MLCLNCKNIPPKPAGRSLSGKLAAFHFIFSCSRFSVLSFVINKFILHEKLAFVIMNDVQWSPKLNSQFTAEILLAQNVLLTSVQFHRCYQFCSEISHCHQVQINKDIKSNEHKEFLANIRYVT